MIVLCWLLRHNLMRYAMQHRLMHARPAQNLKKPYTKLLYAVQCQPQTLQSNHLMVWHMLTLHSLLNN